MKKVIGNLFFLATFVVISTSFYMLTSCKTGDAKIMLRKVTRKNNLSNLYFVLPKHGWDYDDSFMGDTSDIQTIYLFNYHDLNLKYNYRNNSDKFFLLITLERYRDDFNNFSYIALNVFSNESYSNVYMKRYCSSDAPPPSFSYPEWFGETNDSIYIQLQDNIDLEYYAIVDPTVQTPSNSFNAWIDQCYFTKERPTYE